MTDDFPATTDPGTPPAAPEAPPAPAAEQPVAPPAEPTPEPPAPTPAAEQAPPPPEPPVAEAAPEPGRPPSNKRWYVVKVQSGREESIKEAIERRVKIEGLEEHFGQIIIPTEKVITMRAGKRVERKQKKFPGYLMVEVEFNDKMLYLFRETSGVGDFVGGGVNRAPTPMSDREVERILMPQGVEPGVTRQMKSPFEKGDRVRVTDGMFSGMEGEVKDIVEAKNLVRVELTIFGRPVSVEMEYWQVERV